MERSFRDGVDRANQSTRSATDPWLDGAAPHIPARVGTLPQVCLLPGDPGRIDLIAGMLTDFVELGYRREFRLGVGTWNGTPIAACSTGIGGPSTEIAVVELSRLGVQSFIRVGGMGAIPQHIEPGSIARVDRALRDGGSARFYAPHSDDPLEAHPVVSSALTKAALSLGETLTPVTVVSCDSYYLGEGRPLPGLEARAQARLEEIIGRGADAMDMECETVFAVAHALGCRAGAVLATHGNRTTDRWLEDFEPAQRHMLHVAMEAAATL